MPPGVRYEDDSESATRTDRTTPKPHRKDIRENMHVGIHDRRQTIRHISAFLIVQPWQWKINHLTVSSLCTVAAGNQRRSLSSKRLPSFYPREGGLKPEAVTIDAAPSATRFVPSACTRARPMTITAAMPAADSKSGSGSGIRSATIRTRWNDTGAGLFLDRRQTGEYPLPLYQKRSSNALRRCFRSRRKRGRSPAAGQ